MKIKWIGVCNAESGTQHRIRYQLFGGNAEGNKDVGCLGGCHMEAGSWQLPLKSSCAWLFPYYVVNVRTNNTVINVVVPPRCGYCRSWRSLVGVIKCVCKWPESRYFGYPGHVSRLFGLLAEMQKWPHTVC